MRKIGKILFLITNGILALMCVLYAIIHLLGEYFYYLDGIIEIYFVFFVISMLIINLLVMMNKCNKKMLAVNSINIIIIFVVTMITSFYYPHNDFVVKKPVIYAYSQKPQELNITLTKSNNTKVDIEYPLSNNGTWTVKTDADGRLNINDRKYNYLYWEDKENLQFTIDKGFCVKGEDTAKFLEFALSELGLNETEQNDFITYWLPEMINNKYNLITFNPDEYFNMYRLSSDKKANIIRVYMVFEASDREVDLERQNLGAFNDWERNEVTIVEWGGTKK